MNKDFFYIANWKMYWGFDETIAFATDHYDELVKLASAPSANIILCPSSPALYPLAQMFQETPIALGAQDCSGYRNGSFTGQISAQQLHEAGSTFCIIGHSERRQYNAETNLEVAKKLEQLITEKITPIVCIGETEEQFKQGQSLTLLDQQIAPIRELLAKNPHALTTPLLIAYEPTWSIGSNTLAPQDHLETVFAWLSKTATKEIPTINKKLIYGGSVTAQNTDQLKKISLIDGFLIGRASLDFQEFKKIVK